MLSTCAPLSSSQAAGLRSSSSSSRNGSSSSSSGGGSLVGGIRPRGPCRRSRLTPQCAQRSTGFPSVQTGLAALRTFEQGPGAAAVLEGGTLALQALTGHLPAASHYAALFTPGHSTASLAALCVVYALEGATLMQIMRRFDARMASGQAYNVLAVPKRLMSMRKQLFKRFFAAKPTPAVAAAQGSVDMGARPAAQPTAEPKPVRPAAKAPGASSVVPAPPSIRRRPAPTPPEPEQDDQEESAVAKRMKELRDREGYLKNMWYAAALADKVGKEPVATQVCGKELVLFRDEEGRVRCIDNTCPHRGAPLSEGWVSHKDGHSCVVCPYHGFALDGEGTLRNVPAAANKGEWPKRPIVDAWLVEEKGGFIWVFYGSKSLPADERSPIPYVPELDDPEWKPVYEELEFDCNHFGVFENALDMAHIHYLHGDSFGNQGKPEIRDMEATSDAHSVTATFRIHNKPVNAFWALFQVPEVHVTAKGFLPSTSLVTFELGNGLNFTTFVSTCPVSANKSINRFALVRKLSSDKTGIFNSSLWDGIARRAMVRIQLEDKDMVERLRYDQVPAEYSVRADLPQIAFRKLRQQYVDLGYGVPADKVPFAANPARRQ